MMIEPGLYVRIKELENGPNPLPLKNGFNEETAYRTVGMFNASESSDAFYILANDRDETWFISTRHVRIVGVFEDSTDLRKPLNQLH